MKRCNNCGWFNPDTATHCEMCDEELTGLPVENPQEQAVSAPEEVKAPEEPEMSAPPKAGNPLLETVRLAPAASEEKRSRRISPPQSWMPRLPWKGMSPFNARNAGILYSVLPRLVPIAALP